VDVINVRCLPVLMDKVLMGGRLKDIFIKGKAVTSCRVIADRTCPGVCVCVCVSSV